MLISLDHLIKKYELKINGISHFGAHLGQEIDTYLKNNIKNIHLFEPQSKIFNQLINCNNEKNDLKFYNFGLGSKNEKLKLNLDTAESQSSSILTPKTHLELHPNIKFDGSENIEIKIYDDLKIENVNFLNIDVQGYELEALIGCKQSFKSIDYIYTEINSQEVYEDCPLVDDLDLFLGEYDFLRVDTRWFDNLAWGDAFYIKTKFLSKNDYLKAKIKNYIFSFTMTRYIEIKKIKLMNYLNKHFYIYKQSLKRFIRYKKN
tara:strand:- start:588 stop:1370 length:783 start_codon:yes stop_codon:yes gene_type:complete